MKTLIIRLSLFSLAVILFISCLIFLLTDQADNFIRFVPANADIYIHSSKNILTKLPANYKEAIQSWLRQSGVKQETLAIIDQYSNELGIYKDIDGVVFITKRSAKLENSLKNNNIPFVIDQKRLLFPKSKLNFNQESLNSERQAFNFADFTMYAKNITSVFPQLVSLKTAGLDRLTINGNLKKDKLLLSIKYKSEQIPQKLVKSTFQVLPTGTKFYFSNMETKTGLSLINSNPQNLNYQILKKLHGPVEFLETNDQTTIIVQNQTNSQEEIETAIKSGLAQLLPTEEMKTLPDGSESVQLVAKKDEWELTNSVDKNNQQIKSIAEARLKIQIELLKSEKITRITIAKATDRQKAETPSIPAINTPCVQGKFAKDSVIYLDGAKELQASFIHSILINRINSHKTTICID